MKPELRILLLEDNPYDAQLIEHELERAGFVLDVKRVDNEKKFLEALESDPQIILADYTLPAYNALDALRTMRDRDLDIPFVVVTGTLDEERAMACVREGCTDYLLKDRLTRLGQVVTQALEQTRMRGEVRAQRQRIEASERRFRAMIENGGESHILLDRDGFILYSSGRQSLEYPHEDVVGRRINEFLLPHEVPPAMASLLELVAAGPGASHRHEYQARSRTGREIWLNICAINMLADPNVEGIVLTLTDITEARRTRDALEQSERRYRSLFEKTRSVICTHTLDGRVIAVNPAVERILGYRPQELEGLSAVLVLPASDIEHALSEQGPLQREGHFRGMTKAIHKDGSERYMTFECFLEDDRKTVTTHAVDVTDLEVARRQLRRFTEQLQSIVAATSCFMESRDWQLAAVELLRGVRGLTRSTVAYLAIIDAPTPVILSEPAAACALDDVAPLWGRLAEQAVVVDEVDVAVALVVDGRRVGLLGARGTTRSLLPTELLQGLAQTASLIYRSHANQVHEDELHRELREAQKMEAVGRLAGGIAHDFNNVLTGIMGFADIAVGHLDPEHPARVAVDEVRSAADRAISLTRQLLAFGRRQVLDLELLDVNAVVQGIASVLQRTLGEDITLELELAPQAPLVVADIGQLDQVLMNLAINARDAMPRGGRLTLATSRVEQHACAFSCPAATPVACIAVADTGCGMTDEIRDQIFDPFFTTKEEGKGTGLGLPTTLGIVRQLGGCISVHSAVGEGSRFEVHLPLAAPQDEAAPPKEPVAGQQRTVLVVEDEDMVRRLVRMLLTEAGYRVLEAGSAEEAFRMGEAKGEKVDLLIADVVLPTHGGREVAERLKQVWPDLAVIYTSGHNEDVVVTYDVSRHQVPFLQKPYTRAHLLQTVQQTLAGRGDAGAET